jgi:predicted nucleic acid-binding protein
VNKSVIDTSIAVKWVTNEPDSTDARSKAARRKMQGEEFVALDYLFAEAANAIFVKVRRGLLPPNEANDAWRRLLSAPLQVVSALPLLTESLEFAFQFQIAV